MKKFILLMLVLIISVLNFHISDVHALETDPGLSTNAFFMHLKNGDTAEILNMLTGPYLTEKRDLLKNPAYKRYLEKIYKNSYLIINNIERNERDERIVDIEIYFKNEITPLKTRFILKRIHGFWKITEEMRDPEGYY